MAGVDGFDTADRIFSSLSLLIGWPEAITSNAYEVRSVHPIDDRAQRVRSAVRASRRGSVRRKTGVARLGALLSLDGLGLAFDGNVRIVATHHSLASGLWRRASIIA